jgi:polyisoprenoid-binding protein YceI
MKALLAAIAVAATLAPTHVGRSGRAYTVDRAGSHATIVVGKAGLFSFAAGHTHEVNVPTIDGTVVVDADALAQSTVHLTMDARTLTVSGKGEPPKDVPEVQRVMLSEKVLDVARYPAIVFDSQRVTVVRQSGGQAELTVAGTLKLHGGQRSVSAPTTLRFDANMLTASGRFAIRQSEFGIKPVSVAGVVAVKDALDIAFTIVAHPRDP